MDGRYVLVGILCILAIIAGLVFIGIGIGKHKIIFPVIGIILIAAAAYVLKLAIKGQLWRPI